ncbi:MAG: hypothetical protein LBU11_08495, partial [Zoogloeaceae bacterium]|nr:hypothetical protein [Zoogloeaceae bacterium]
MGEKGMKSKALAKGLDKRRGVVFEKRSVKSRRREGGACAMGRERKRDGVGAVGIPCGISGGD